MKLYWPNLDKLTGKPTMNNRVYTGIAADDRRIARDLQAMGAFDQGSEDAPSYLAKKLEPLSQFITWMRWKGEVAVYGCRVGVSRTAMQKISA
tara:strand:+ start:164 stop:442 length:279 start_codon:yes stop_codon:yes gene_type:complete